MQTELEGTISKYQLYTRGRSKRKDYTEREKIPYIRKHQPEWASSYWHILSIFLYTVDRCRGI